MMRNCEKSEKFLLPWEAVSYWKEKGGEAVRFQRFRMRVF
jgi:hypothetical protein